MVAIIFRNFFLRLNRSRKLKKCLKMNRSKVVQHEISYQISSLKFWLSNIFIEMWTWALRLTKFCYFFWNLHASGSKLLWPLKNAIIISARWFNFFNLQSSLKVRKFSKIIKKLKKELFWKLKKLNYYTYFDPEWPLTAFFHHYLIFQEFSKKYFLLFF